MLNLPILDRLDISGYGLFPGTEGAEPGFHAEFKPGLTLILGANGLGKTTLITIVYRLLTGPFDIPGLTTRSELGNIRLTPTALSTAGRAVFAQRVVDGARHATARLSLRLGQCSVVVERRLSDLALTHLSVDGTAMNNDELGTFQPEFMRLAGVWSFGDWILLLRHLVFYFEDRRALVWDSTAQRQVLRLLFLPPQVAGKWTEDERAILELDSRTRNLNAAVYREERALTDSELKSEAALDVRQELQTLENLQLVDEEGLNALENEVVEIEMTRQQARLRFLKAEQERDSRFRDLERAKLTAISTRFPDRSETARYILSHLLTENSCVVCGHVAPEAAAEYTARIDEGKCIVCGTDLSGADGLVPASEVADRRVDRLALDLPPIENEMAEARHALGDAEQRHQAHFGRIQELNSELSERSRRIDSLVMRLPPDEADMHKQRSELTAMRSRVEMLRIELAAIRLQFGGFVERVSRELVMESAKVMRAFDVYAEGFLLETCRLIWSPQKARLGETGVLIDFPAFEIEMSGADSPSLVRRTGPDQVSESQREFIDLAFRMALMSIADNSGSGTLVIDAPESSLDAVFVTRAADVLSRFAEPERGNRLLITSNLVEGRLIPSLIAKGTTTEDRLVRIVNLFKVAAPTVAVQQLRSEYDGIWDSLVEQSGDAS
jgi:hypothetical protein